MLDALNLSHRDALVLRSVVSGRSRAEIARELRLSEAEVAALVDNLLRHIAHTCR